MTDTTKYAGSAEQATSDKSAQSECNGLLACPFCGGQASSAGTTKYHHKHEAWWENGERITESFFCNCIKCGVTNSGLCGHQTRELAIEHWNNRVS
jgi:hypothetical protein